MLAIAMVATASAAASLLPLRVETRRNRCAMTPTCAIIAKIKAEVVKTKKRLRVALSKSIPSAASGAPFSSRRTGSPSGPSPMACGEGRISIQETGITPSRKPAASHGVAPSIPKCSIMLADTGVSRIPPSERPVDAMESAIDRLRTNHLATSVVPGMSAAPAYPMPKST